MPFARPAAPEAGTVLRRAMSSRSPGPIFAEAASQGETDPLTDPEVRLWVGLLPS
jgi:hypothetical protein